MNVKKNAIAIAAVKKNINKMAALLEQLNFELERKTRLLQEKQCEHDALEIKISEMDKSIADLKQRKVSLFWENSNLTVEVKKQQNVISKKKNVFAKDNCRLASHCCNLKTVTFSISSSKAKKRKSKSIF